MNLTEKQQISLPRLCLICAIVLSLICVGTLVFSIILRNAAYDSFTEISAATDNTQRINQYIRAIQLRPALPDAYIKLLEAFGSDGRLSKQESEAFLSIYNANRAALDKKNAGYAQLHYEAGFLYINGYEDTNSTTRLRMALPFFESAASAGDAGMEGWGAIQTYCRMGRYYRNYIWDAAAETKEIPKAEINALITEIRDTLAVLSADDAADGLYNRLGFSLAVCNLLFEQRDVLSVTVPYEAVTGVLGAVYDGLPEVTDLQKDRLKQMLGDLLGNEETYRAMLERAYERKGSGEQ